MTALFSSNFDSTTTGTYPTGWVSAAGAGMQVQSTGATGATVVSGANGFGRNNGGDAAIFNSSGLLTNQGIRSAHKLASVTSGGFRFIGHLLRSNSTTSISYRIEVATDNTALRCQITRYDGGGVLLANSSFFLSPSPTDIVHLFSKITGGLIEVWMWIGSTMPSTPTLSFDDSGGSLIANGYPGLRNLTGSWVLADDVVVTDGAGGEDVFYPGATTLNAAAVSLGTATSSLTNQIRFQASVIAIATATAYIASPEMYANAFVNVNRSAALSTGILLVTSGLSQATATSALTAIAAKYFDTPPMKNNNGTVLGNETGLIVNVYNVTTGALVVRKTGLTSDVNGVVRVSDLSLTTATYAYEVVTTAKGRRLPTVGVA